MSCLIDVVPDTQQPDEPKDHKFASYCLEELEPTQVLEAISTEVIEVEAVTSEGIEYLLNSQESSEVEGIMLNFEEKPLKKQSLFDRSKSSKSSREL